MTFDPEIAVAAADRKLSFERTVERSLVHRAAVGEVFVTDVHIVDPNRYLAGAQLPLGHGYYGDHGDPRAPFDTLLLLESCRQASIYGAHQAMGLPADITMMVSDWSIRLDPQACPAVGRTPGELGLIDAVQARHGPKGDVRGLRFDLELWMARRRVGQAHIQVGCTTKEQYAALRYLQRGDDPPKTGDLAAGGEGDPVSPELVGRQNPANVVLTDPERDGDTVSARLAPRFDHPSLFDHSYDHYPAMVLMEAARQLSLLAVAGGADDGEGGGGEGSGEGEGGGAAARHLVATGFDAGFERFAELDAPVVARATPHGEHDDDGGHPVTATEVVFEQGGERIARSAVDLVDLSDLADRTDGADRAHSEGRGDPRWKGAA